MRSCPCLRSARSRHPRHRRPSATCPLRRLCRRARAIGRFVYLWSLQRLRGAAGQLAVAERFYWPLPEGVSVEEATKRRKQLLHTVGNLTLVTEKLNPAMSNGSWPRKKAALGEHSSLAMNRKLIAMSEWDEEAIEVEEIHDEKK